jgi:Zn-dependent membrane protease YugP
MASGYMLMIVIALVSFAVQWRFKSKFRQYAEIGLLSGLSGKEVAERMLKDNGIYDVKVISTDGQLTDHYNPETKTVNLSADVYESRSIASAAVAAHECGHAVQHAKAYSWLSSDCADGFNHYAVDFNARYYAAVFQRKPFSSGNWRCCISFGYGF